MTLLKIHNLTKRFGKFYALDGVDLELNGGEVYGFIGPNGAGKSTTIKAILGMLKPTKGSIEIFGKNALKDAVDVHKDLAFVPGDVNFWLNLTGGEIIDFFLSLHPKANYDRKNELIKRFELDTTKKCSTYSTGNRQKVALITAFSIDAKLYILDEPTSGLDPLMEEVFQECIRDIKNNNKSVLLSSHILSEVEKLCDRVGIIRKGKMITSGTLDEMRHLTRMQFKVESAQQLGALIQVTGVHNVRQEDNAYYFEVDSDKISAVIEYLSRFEIKKLESMPPTLEAIFKRYYEATDELGE
ncbi:ABC transporter ATP-binding protein [Staphylococcus sp. NAM3COL9]|uniref:ABC transporter ATP-binding protein n=1 Tax=Staphylococcus sp. NAM3COL9 TaxID=1667172 RepID=UPI00070B6505|nr:ABC transporter ATP-binding protein [Staphylococcus sp. NAM3COL9]KRG11177.1 ABC transporter ATP-binding protein [Staphylococcus sp. NAM3COL9]